MKKYLLASLLFAGVSVANAQTNMFAETEANSGIYHVCATQESLTAEFGADKIAEAWGMGVWLDANYQVFKDDKITVTTAVSASPIYFSGNKINECKEAGATGYFNMGSQSGDQSWTDATFYIYSGTDLESEVKKSYMGILKVVPTSAGKLSFSVFCGDNKRVIGISKILTDAEVEAGAETSLVAYKTFRNDGTEGTVLNGPGTIECDVEANRPYLLLAGGQKNLNLFEITFKSTSTGITSITTDATAKNAAIYNLAGQKVSNSYKGIVIKNGKKYLAK